jgi:hypothetical protein
MSVRDDEMLIVRSIRAGFEQFGIGGSSLNATQNPFIIHVNGEFDLLKTSALVLKNFNSHRALKEAAARVESDKAALAAAQTGDSAPGTLNAT